MSKAESTSRSGVMLSVEETVVRRWRRLAVALCRGAHCQPQYDHIDLNILRALCAVPTDRPACRGLPPSLPSVCPSVTAQHRNAQHCTTLHHADAPYRRWLQDRSDQTVASRGATINIYLLCGTARSRPLGSPRNYTAMSFSYHRTRSCSHRSTTIKGASSSSSSL